MRGSGPVSPRYTLKGRAGFGNFQTTRASFPPMTNADPNTVLKIMERALGHKNVSDDVAGHSIDDLQPKAVVFPSNVQQLSQVMASAWEANMAVAPWGGGTPGPPGQSHQPPGRGR